MSSCTKGFMKLDLLRKNAELISNDRSRITSDRLSTKIGLFTSMNFTSMLHHRKGIVLVADEL